MSKTLDSQMHVDSSYCFKWSHYHNYLSEVVRQLLEERCMVDVTLVADGERIQAHRVILGACSILFQEVLSQVNDEHPVLILSGISAQDIRSIVEFIYNGEIRIPVESFDTFLNAAHYLNIKGLVEIDRLDDPELSNDKDEDNEVSNDKDEDNDKDLITEETYFLSDLSQIEPEEELDQIIEADSSNNNTSNNKKISEKKNVNSESEIEIRKRKRRKSVCKREYTDAMLANAIADIRAGKSLLESAAQNNIPRSTLYMRAKSLGITLNPSRSEYTLEDMKGAIQAVLEGSSLQQASDCYGIPKTVLWRRIQKEGYHTPRQDQRKTYGAEIREAAVKALERGETLTKVANEYKIPKTTLFRDKARLVDQGKLPSSFWKKRKTDGEDLKRSRLEEAVAACKNGKMSQATASVTYQIPKTTIWRRLQKESPKKDTSPRKNRSKSESSADLNNSESLKNEELNEGDFEAYCPDEGEMSITYIEESNLSDSPVIILASGDSDDISLQNRSLVVVQEGSDEMKNFISCGLDLDENSIMVETS